METSKCCQLLVSVLIISSILILCLLVSGQDKNNLTLFFRVCYLC